MSKRSAHGTHVWVRTELIEAILHHQGTLPKGWKPSSNSTNRRLLQNGDSRVTDWGWARATISNVSAPHESSSSGGGGGSNPFGGVQLRKTNSSASSSRTNPNDPEENEGSTSAVPQLVTATIVVDDDEFAPQHLRYSPVSLTYDAKDTSLVCMTNSWWREASSNSDNNSRSSSHHHHQQQQHPPDDLTSLAHLHEPAVVFCLQRRYERDDIYTYTGKVLLALNPFRPLDHHGVYGEEIMQHYWNMGYSATRPPPHVYAVRCKIS